MTAEDGIDPHVALGAESAQESPLAADLRRASRIIWLLAASLGALMTGYAITMPLFARRLDEFGSGVSALSLMSTAYALAGIVASPLMGTLADRVGRRPLVLASLVFLALANVGYLLATSPQALVVVRALEGALSAGLSPAVLGIVADIAPADKRARWLGLVTGGAAVGWVLGPVAGGVLYDAWGFAVPFMLSAGICMLAFVAVAILVPETRPRAMRRREASSQHAVTREQTTIGPLVLRAKSLWAALPRPLPAFGIALCISLVMYFAWAFVEAQLLFYVFDDLGWTTAQFGLAVAGYGLASALGQTMLGRMGDRFGRKPPIVVGLILFSAQFAGPILTHSWGPMLLSFTVAGLGEGLVSPALNAFLLDISEERHRARVMGIKTAAGSLGGVIGPALSAATAVVLAPQNAFAASAAVVLLGVLLALVLFREP
jgi:multidrug resistance protein